MKLSMNLEEYRLEIDEINWQIIQNLARRFSLSARVAEYKKVHGLEVFDPQREKEMFARIRSQAEELGLEAEFVVNLFQTIVEETHLQEKRILGQSR